jgi:hypothetical protein
MYNIVDTQLARSHALIKPSAANKPTSSGLIMGVMGIALSPHAQGARRDYHRGCCDCDHSVPLIKRRTTVLSEERSVRLPGAGISRATTA